MQVSANVGFVGRKKGTLPRGVGLSVVSVYNSFEAICVYIFEPETRVALFLRGQVTQIMTDNRQEADTQTDRPTQPTSTA